MDPSYLSLVLLPNEDDRNRLIVCSQAIGGVGHSRSSIVLGENTLPHITIMRFIAPDSAAAELTAEAKRFSGKITNLISGGLRFTPDVAEDKTWVDIQFLKSVALAELQAAVGATSFAQKYVIHNKQGDAYQPHSTLALLDGKTIPNLDLRPFSLFRKDFNGLQLAVGVTRPDLTIVSAQNL